MGNSPSSFYVNGHKCSNIHVSCASDDYEPNTDYVGLIFFHKNGQTDIYFGGKHLKIGYLVIAKSSKLSSYNSGEGQVHGNCFKVCALLPKGTMILCHPFQFCLHSNVPIHTHLQCIQSLALFWKSQKSLPRNKQRYVHWRLLVPKRKLQMDF